MKKGLKYLIVALCAGLGACAMIPSPGDPAAHKVLVSGRDLLGEPADRKHLDRDLNRGRKTFADHCSGYGWFAAGD